MGAVWMRCRTSVRTGWRTVVFLTLLVGLGGGLAVAAAAGARRSQHVLPSFLEFSAGADVGVFIVPKDGPVFGPGGDRAQDRATIAALPSVARALRAADSLVAVPDPDSPSGWSTLLGVAAIDAGVAETVGQPIIVSGRMPAAAQADEIAINEEMAQRRDLSVGSVVPLGAFSREQFDAAGHGEPLVPSGRVSNARVTGIVRYPSDLLPVRLGHRELSSDHSEVYLTPAWWAVSSPDVATYGVVIGVWTKPGGDVATLRRAVADIYDKGAFVSTGSIGYDYGNGLPGVRRAISIERLALIVFGLLGAFATVMLFAQALVRRMWNDARTVPVIRALGMTNGQIGYASALTAVPVALGGAALAVVIAVALSPALPIGVARRADLDHGVHADWLALGVGAAAIALVVVALAFLLGHSVARRTTVRGDRLARSGTRSLGAFGERLTARLPVTAATGTRFATSGIGGIRAVPAVATVAAVGAVCAAATFTSSLDHLVREPSRYGAVWDVTVGNYADPTGSDEAADWLAADADVDSFAGIQSEDVSIDGKPVTVIVAVPGKGIIHWPLLEGHAPVGPSEIALGSNTLADLHKQVGDTVSLSAGGDVIRDLTVVGRTVLAAPDVEGVEPGRGALIDISAAAPFVNESGDVFASNFVIRLRSDADVDAAVARLHDRFFSTTTYPTTPPNAVLNVTRVSRLPVLLAALVAALSGAVFVHTLTGEIRQRRKELAVLKTMGLRGRQISAVLAWQSSTIAAVGVALGVPIGLLVGRAGWRIVSEQIGVAWSTAVPVVTIVALGAAAVLLANTVALVPGLRARRTHPATALRAE